MDDFLTAGAFDAGEGEALPQKRQGMAHYRFISNGLS